MFDVAREPLAAPSAGWVYRSDAPAPAVTAAPPAARSAPPAARPAPPSVRPAPRFLAAAADRLVSPVALALTIALAPLRGFGGSRSRR